MPMPEMRPVMFLTLIFSACAAAVLAAGCEERESIAFYNAPKDPPPTTAPVTTIADAQAAGAGGAAAPAGGASAKTKLHWDAPPSWKEMPAGQMRVAQLRVNGEPPVDVTVIPLQPELGSLLPNA